MISNLKRARLSACALGTALGFLKGGWMLFVGLTASHGGYGTEMVTHLATLYPGVEATIKGAWILAGWGFLTGFFMGLVLAWIYNLCVCCCSRAHCACCKTTTGENCCNVEKIYNDAFYYLYL